MKPLNPEDWFGPQPPIVMNERLKLEKKLGEHGRLQDTTFLLKKPIVIESFYYPKSRAWFIDGGKIDKAKAIKLGKRVQRHLKGRRTLTADLPYMHYLDLYVGYDGGTVKLPPAIARAHTVALLDRVADVLESRGRRDLAAVVDAAANELLEQRDDMLEQTGFDDVMKRTDDVADEIYEHRIESLDMMTLYDRP